MAKLKNTFSWSFSAAADFDECRRRRYWSKYGMWGGWERGADAVTQQAYRLNKMTNRWGLMGQAAENAIMWVLKQHQQGKTVTVDDAWKTIARPFMTKKWTESLEGSENTLAREQRNGALWRISTSQYSDDLAHETRPPNPLHYDSRLGSIPSTKKSDANSDSGSSKHYLDRPECRCYTSSLLVGL